MKAIIEDCGYSSVHDELAYQLDDMFSLPAFPLMQVTSLVTKVRAGYFFGEANAVEQLKKTSAQCSLYMETKIHLYHLKC